MRQRPLPTLGSAPNNMRVPSQQEIQLVNTALYLRRPLLVTGDPGVGKSTLAYAVAHELGLGPVMRWPITTRSTLYHYDLIGRLREENQSCNHLPKVHERSREINQHSIKPRPPSCARAIASGASVTVSIAADNSGMFK